jgi:HK97 gp10 family phage protein
MEIKVDVIGDAKLLQSMRSVQGFIRSRELRVALEDAKNALVKVAQDAAPRDSRFLRQSITGQVENWGTDHPAVRAGTHAHYAPDVEFGTRPHAIFPFRKKALFWVNYDNPKSRPHLKGAGAVFTFARMVRHPGTKAQPFMRPAYQAVKPRLIQAMTRILKAKMTAGSGPTVTLEG